MSAELTYFGRVVDGQLKITHRAQFDADVKLFDGQAVVLKLRKKVKTRSVAQNSYYWCVVKMVLHGLIDVGYEREKLDEEVVHDFLKNKFLRVDCGNSDTGEVLDISLSTRGISTSRMMDYIADIQRWAAEFLGIQIPEPGDQTAMSF